MDAPWSEGCASHQPSPSISTAATTTTTTTTLSSTASRRVVDAKVLSAVRSYELR